MNNVQYPVSGTGKIPSLDGVRGLSFLIVFVAHAGLDHLIPGRFAVSMFFLLSGYLITTLFIRERQKTGNISLRLFYLRRALRLFPPLYAVLATLGICLVLTHKTAGITVAGVCAPLFYYQNYWWRGGVIPGLGPLWTLSVEEHFYLLFPLLLLLLFRLGLNYGQIAKTLLIICAVILGWRFCVVTFMTEGIRWSRTATDTRADAILYGCCLACLEQVTWFRQKINQRFLERWVVPVSLVALLPTFLIRNDLFRETLRYSLQSVAIAALLLYLVHFPYSRAGRVANSYLLARIGELSYGLYLVHGVVLVYITPGLTNPWFAGLVAFLITVGLALVIHYLIERPTEGLRRKFRSSVPQPSQLSLATAGPNQVELPEAFKIA